MLSTSTSLTIHTPVLLEECIDDLEVLAELLISPSEVMLTDLAPRIIERTRRRLMVVAGVDTEH